MEPRFNRRKRCGKCKLLCFYKDFYKSKGKPQSYCKNCSKEALEDYRYSDAYYLRRYGITLAQYEALLVDQGYCCAICGKGHKAIVTKKWERARLGVDHDHKTGRVRGLLCHSCNVALGLFQESEENLLRAYEYLKCP